MIAPDFNRRSFAKLSIAAGAVAAAPTGFGQDKPGGTLVLNTVGVFNHLPTSERHPREGVPNRSRSAFLIGSGSSIPT